MSFLVKRHGRIVSLHTDSQEARNVAVDLNAQYQTDEYRVEEYDWTRHLPEDDS